MFHHKIAPQPPLPSDFTLVELKIFWSHFSGQSMVCLFHYGQQSILNFLSHRAIRFSTHFSVFGRCLWLRHNDEIEERSSSIGRANNVAQLHYELQSNNEAAIILKSRTLCEWERLVEAEFIVDLFWGRLAERSRAVIEMECNRSDITGD